MMVVVRRRTSPSCSSCLKAENIDREKEGIFPLKRRCCRRETERGGMWVVERERQRRSE